MTLKKTLGLLLVLVLAGCISRTQPSRFYTLTAEVAEAERGSVTIGVPIVGMGPIELPRYLQRPQMVVRADDNELILDEFARWGDGLDLQIGRIASENLALLSADALVLPFPWRQNFQPDLRVIGHVMRFEADTAGLVRLDLRWGVVDMRSGEALSVHSSSYTAPVDASDAASIAAGMSDALANFSRAAAADLAQSAARAAAAADAVTGPD
jgi:uncharacterized lipoprotein YmbA